MRSNDHILTLMPSSASAFLSARDPSAANVPANGTWVEIAVVLRRVEEDGSWSRHSRGFSSWVLAQAERNNVDQSSYWRYLGSSKFYSGLRPLLLQHGLECPEFSALPSEISAESLEILAKLARVAPVAEVVAIARRLLQRDVSRAELRKLWQIYRPALEGRTARGRGVDLPSVDSTSSVARSKLDAARLVVSLSAHPHAWFSASKPVLATSVLDVSVNGSDVFSSRWSFDLVLLLQKDFGSPLELHGVDIQSALSVRVMRGLADRARFVDYLWIALTKASTAKMVALLPPYVGVLIQDDGGIKVVKRAERTPASAEDLLITSRALLAKAVTG